VVAGGGACASAGVNEIAWEDPLVALQGRAVKTVVVDTVQFGTVFDDDNVATARGVPPDVNNNALFGCCDGETTRDVNTPVEHFAFVNRVPPVSERGGDATVFGPRLLKSHYSILAKTIRCLLRVQAGCPQTHFF